MKHSMKTGKSWVALGTAAVLSAGMLAGPLMPDAHAQKGRRNAAIAAGAVTAYGALKGNRTLTIAGGLGTAYAYKRYRDAKRSNRPQTIRQVFGATPVYDSRGKRYNPNSRFHPNRTYYNARGRAIG
jgi:hypothetical protein